MVWDLEQHPCLAVTVAAMAADVMTDMTGGKGLIDKQVSLQIGCDSKRITGASRLPGRPAVPC